MTVLLHRNVLLSGPTVLRLTVQFVGSSRRLSAVGKPV